MNNICFAFLLNIVALFYVLIINGCTKQDQSPPVAQLISGKVISHTELYGYCGDDAYAVVSRSALPILQSEYEQKGPRLPKWDGRYDCNKIVSAFIARAQYTFAVSAWHDSTKASALALASVWYRRDSGKGHALVEARTEQGVIYWDPQESKEVQLSKTEESAIYLRIW